jgi:hypothetical protein
MCCVSCKTDSKFSGAVSVEPGKATPAKFLKASPDSFVLMTRLTDKDGHYMLIYSEDFKKGVIFDVENDATNGHFNVRNIGFGTDTGNGQWSLYSKGGDGTIFESQGGEWTLQHFAALLTEGIKQKHQRIRFKDAVRD